MAKVARLRPHGADLLGEWQSIEDVEARFAPTMHAEDWATIRDIALEQAELKKGK